MSSTLTTKEAAARLGVSPARVRQLVLAGNLPAAKFGRDLMIQEGDLKLVADRPIGRPPKAKAAAPARRSSRKSREAKP
jgi:excisionase family DNA binding protein